MAETAAAPTMVLPVHRRTPWFRVRITSGARSITTEHWQSALGFIPLRRRRIGKLSIISWSLQLLEHRADRAQVGTMQAQA